MKRKRVAMKLMDEYGDEFVVIRGGFDKFAGCALCIAPVSEWFDYDKSDRDWEYNISQTMPVYQAGLDMGFTLRDIRGWYVGSGAGTTLVFETRDNISVDVEIQGARKYVPGIINLTRLYDGARRIDNPDGVPDDICRFVQRVMDAFRVHCILVFEKEN